MNTTLSCDMVHGCAGAVTHLDRDGYIYCTDHGISRRAGGTPCRKLRPHELARLGRGETIASYS